MKREGRLTQERDPVGSPWVEPEMGNGKWESVRFDGNWGTEKQREQGNDEEGVGVEREYV